MIRTLFLALSIFFNASYAIAGGNDLSKLVVVVDSGHGGDDPGAHGVFANQEIFESEYVYDVAKRIEREVEWFDGKVFLTTRKKSSANLVRNWWPNLVLPRDKSEVFALDGEPVKAGREGLRKRTGFANQILGRFRSSKRVLFISVHFDSLGNENGGIYGMRIITPDVRSRLTFLVADSCRKRLRENNPVVASGDQDHGMPNLLVLRELYNKIEQRILIELGNFGNPADIWRIRNPQVREDYAKCIVEALKKF